MWIMKPTSRSQGKVCVWVRVRVRVSVWVSVLQCVPETRKELSTARGWLYVNFLAYLAWVD
jgi:hypothetical protein